MGRLLICFSLLLTTLSTWGHDMRLAQYVIYVHQDQIICDIRIDLEDFKNAMHTDIDEEEVGRFIGQHLKFSFDRKEIVTQLIGFETSTDWIELSLSLETSNHSPHQVEIFNNILSEEIEGHDNLMRFVLRGKTRIFRLNKNRQQISFSYNKS